MSTARSFAASVRLADGRILIAGGDDGTAPVAGAELYDPATRQWAKTGSMGTVRSYAAAAMLKTGQVLVVGGYSSRTSGSELSSAELSRWSRKTTAEAAQPERDMATDQ
jgi:hypothetical protein